MGRFDLGAAVTATFGATGTVFGAPGGLMLADLGDFLTPISSGLEPQPGRTGVLNRERATELDQRLRALDAARADAEQRLRVAPHRDGVS